ncbi:hypothetical protein [Peribacillus asahii]|nr:hypothetical protein [Peribacillus asahii]
MKQIDIDKLLEDTGNAVGETCFLNRERVDIDQLLEQTTDL